MQRADCVLPVIGGWNRATFYHAATGKPDKAGLQIGDHLRNVRAQSIRTVFESSRRKKRNHVKPDGALRTSGQDQAGVSIAFHAGEGGIVLLPPGSHAGKADGFAEDVAAVIFKRRCQRPVKSIRAPCPERKLELFTGHDPDTPEAMVGNAQPPWRRGVNFQPARTRRFRRERITQVQVHGTLCATFLDERPEWQAVGEISETVKSRVISIFTRRIHPAAIMINVTFRRLGVFKPAILNQLCVESAIHGVIEVLQKNSVHPRVERWSFFGGVNIDAGRARAQANYAGQKKQSGEITHKGHC